MYSVFVFIFLFIALAAIFIYFSPVLYNMIHNTILKYKSEENVKKIKTIMSDLDEKGGI
jgi:hypothetical protein